MKWWEILILVIAAVLYIESSARRVATILAAEMDAISRRTEELLQKFDDLQETVNEIRDRTESRDHANPIDIDRRI